MFRERQNVESTVAPGTEHFFMSQFIAFEQPLEYFLSVDLTSGLELRHVQIDIHLLCQVSHGSFRDIWYGLSDQLAKLLTVHHLIFVKIHVSGRLAHELGCASSEARKGILFNCRQGLSNIAMLRRSVEPIEQVLLRVEFMGQLLSDVVERANLIVTADGGDLAGRIFHQYAVWRGQRPAGAIRLVLELIQLLFILVEG